MAVKTDARTGHDIAYVTRGHAAGCAGAMACYVRTGHHSKETGEWRDGKGLVATSWLHTISRDGDPQLHVHLAVLNAVQRIDGADDDEERRKAWADQTTEDELHVLSAVPPDRIGRPRGLRPAHLGFRGSRRLGMRSDQGS